MFGAVDDGGKNSGDDVYTVNTNTSLRFLNSCYVLHRSVAYIYSSVSAVLLKWPLYSLVLYAKIIIPVTAGSALYTSLT